jgi:hypothetical protein
MKKYTKKAKLLAFMLMISFVLFWLLILYYFYYLESYDARRIFSILLLATPVIIIIIDRPTIFMDITNAILDTIGYIVVVIYEQIDKFIESRKEPKYQRQVRRRDKIKKWLQK